MRELIEDYGGIVAITFVGLLVCSGMVAIIGYICNIG